MTQEVLSAAVAAYIMVALVSCAGLAIAQIEARAHWTRPFAGILWPALAVLALVIIWRETR